MKNLRHTAFIAFAAFLGLTGIVAAGTAISTITGAQYSPQASNPLNSGKPGTWVDTSNNLHYETGSISQTVAAVAATTKGDIAAYNGTAWVRVGVGTDGQALVAASSQASGLAWENVATDGNDMGTAPITGTITANEIAVGAGTNQVGGSSAATYTSAGGVVLTGSSGNQLSGDTTYGLGVHDSTSDNSSIDLTATGANIVTGGGTYESTFTDDGALKIPSSSAAAVAGQIRFNGTNLQYSDASSWKTIATSVGMSVPSIMSVSGSPITQSGTLAVTLNTETASTALLGPISGSAAAPTFRALVQTDLPNNPYFYTSTYMQGLSPSLNTGNYTQGALFWVDQASHIVGAQWFHPLGATNNIMVELWDVTAGGGAVASKTVTPTAGAINTASFASAYAITGSAVGHQFSLTLYDGINQILYTGGVPTPLSFGPTMWGPHLFLYGFGIASGHSGALATGSNYTGLDPVYSVP